MGKKVEKSAAKKSESPKTETIMKSNNKVCRSTPRKNIFNGK